jgi:septal ring factor EnvC (AmiA/AmiB activator)
MERVARRVLIGMVALFSASLLAGAAEVDRDLERIKKKIASEKRDLTQLQTKEGSVLESLGKIQTELERSSQELQIAQAKFAGVASELRMTQTEAHRLGKSVAARQELFQKRAVALYRWQKSGSPLAVFSGNASFNDFLQRRRYLQAALTFDRELLTQLQEESRRQEILRDELAQKKAELNAQRLAISRAKEAVRREAEKKKVLLASLRREKSTRLRALKEMEAAAGRLEKMLEEISKRAVAKPRETPMPPMPGGGMESLRGALEWPVKGAISAPFGKFKHPEFAAEIVRSGVDIEASTGEAVRVVERGRIVYADRFSGYGKMVIVDHGERYFTIYGHLSEILKKNGDEIGRGEVLGRVGDSDSLAGSKLYFELRKDGRSVDPKPWFKKR